MRLDYLAAEKEAIRNIAEEPKLVQPCVRTVNLSKCYMDLKARYDKATELLLALNKGSPIESVDLEAPQNIHLKQLHHDVIEFIGEDWDMRILGYKDVI